MEHKARVIVPFWGEDYLRKFLKLMLPSLLAPGNLPHLAAAYETELLLITEEGYFDRVRADPGYLAATKICAVKLIALDDLLAAQSYGPALTFALFRGFTDLGAEMTNYYLFFLCADWIVADGSYVTAVRLMKQGHRVIHNPSFRTTLEEVFPLLEKQVDPATGILAMPPREMVELAFAHKHQTVRARTHNQKIFHQYRMDQFYWYVDEATLVGFQWPVALVCLRPERVLTEPSLVFDYSFVPDACPEAEPYFIGDSDDFFMLEMQKRDAGSEMLRVGWIRMDDMVADLNLWTTREHRLCGRQPHIFHYRDLPEETGDVAAEGQRYIDGVIARLAPAVPHKGHPLLSNWWNGAVKRIKEGAPAVQAAAPVEPAPPPGLPSAILAALAPFVRRQLAPLKKMLSAPLKKAYSQTFGRGADLKVLHPGYLDSVLVKRCLSHAGIGSDGKRTIGYGESDSVYGKMLGEWGSTSELSYGKAPSVPDETFDAAYFELTPTELPGFRKLYMTLRPKMKNGGRIVLSAQNTRFQLLSLEDVSAFEAGMPEVDISKMSMSGGEAAFKFKKAHWARMYAFFRRPRLRFLWTVFGLVLWAPAVYYANKKALAEGFENPVSHWTSLAIEFTVKKGAAARQGQAKSP